MLILGFPDYLQPAQALAKAMQADYATLKIHNFPDGESKITLPPELPDTVVLVRTLNNPNAKLLELLITAAAARQQNPDHRRYQNKGVGKPTGDNSHHRRIILVAPYLCYMRQDIAFHPGEAVSQKIIGNLLADHFDAVITVDPHLHRISELSEAIPKGDAIALSAAPLMGRVIGELLPAGPHGNSPGHLLVGPDEESAQWVKQVAAPAQLDYVVASKIRHGDRHVEITLPDFEYAGREAILIDDVISSGHTLMRCAQLLQGRGCRSVSALCTHPLLAPGAEEALHSAGISTLISTDSILHTSNRISLTPLLADALRQLIGDHRPLADHKTITNNLS